MKSAIIALAMVFTGVMTVWGQEYQVLDPSPLMPSKKSDLLLKHAAKQLNRQNEETFTLAGKAAPAGWFHVDLKPHCNMNLFSKDGVTAPVAFHAMELGRREFYGVPMDILTPADNDNRTALALPSTRYLPKTLPDTAEVPVGRKAHVLYILHATYYTLPGGDCYYRMNYADGESHVLPFIARKQSGDWYHASTRIHTEHVRYVLVPSRPGSKLHFRNMHLLEWENPNPDKVIKSLTFKSDTQTEMAIFIVAITGNAGN